MRIQLLCDTFVCCVRYVCARCRSRCSLRDNECTNILPLISVHVRLHMKSHTNFIDSEKACGSPLFYTQSADDVRSGLRRMGKNMWRVKWNVVHFVLISFIRPIPISLYFPFEEVFRWFCVFQFPLIVSYNRLSDDRIYMRRENKYVTRMLAQSVDAKQKRKERKHVRTHHTLTVITCTQSHEEKSVQRQSINDYIRCLMDEVYSVSFFSSRQCDACAALSLSTF